jgi:hypothetical protein
MSPEIKKELRAAPIPIGSTSRSAYNLRSIGFVGAENDVQEDGLEVDDEELPELQDVIFQA